MSALPPERVEYLFRKIDAALLNTDSSRHEPRLATQVLCTVAASKAARAMVGKSGGARGDSDDERTTLTRGVSTRNDRKSMLALATGKGHGAGQDTGQAANFEEVSHREILGVPKNTCTICRAKRVPSLGSSLILSTFARPRRLHRSKTETSTGRLLSSRGLRYGVNFARFPVPPWLSHGALSWLNTVVLIHTFPESLSGGSMRGTNGYVRSSVLWCSSVFNRTCNAEVVSSDRTEAHDNQRGQAKGHLAPTTTRKYQCFYLFEMTGRGWHGPDIIGIGLNMYLACAAATNFTTVHRQQ